MIRAMEKHFRGFTIIHIPRAQNDEADRLAKAAARKQQLPPDVFFEEISTPSTRAKKESRINAIFSEDWRAPIMAPSGPLRTFWSSRREKTLPKSKSVAEPPELSRLKCAGHHHKGNTCSNALQTEQFLVCRITSWYNHRFSDRTSIPRTKASPEIL